MAQGDTPITLVGNLVADPELRFIPNGAAVTTIRVASTPRVYNRETNQWEDGDALFLTCNIWRQAAENVAESLTKGARVVVVGKLKQRSYQTREGENRTVFEVDADEIAPSLRYATAQITRNEQTGQGGGWNNSQPQGQDGGWGGNSQPQGQPQGQGQGGNWGGNNQSQGQGQGQGDNQTQIGNWGNPSPTGGFGAN